MKNTECEYVHRVLNESWRDRQKAKQQKTTKWQQLEYLYINVHIYIYIYMYVCVCNPNMVRTTRIYNIYIIYIHTMTFATAAVVGKSVTILEKVHQQPHKIESKTRTRQTKRDNFIIFPSSLI